MVEQRRWPGRSAVDTIVFGELAWPLGRTAAADAIAAARERRRHAVGCDRLVERIAAAWHHRQRANDLDDAIAARLAEDEADAELAALTGDDAEDEP